VRLDDLPDLRLGLMRPCLRVALRRDCPVALGLFRLQALRLELGGVDILEHASGRRYLLEANFPCYFALPETIAGVDVSGALIEHLVAKSHRLTREIDPVAT